MIDRHELLATLKPLVTQLEQSIGERALATQEVAAHLEQEHQKAVVAGRTAMSLEEWRDDEITQAAVAWVLGCVFVRFLEDNGLIDQALISGPGGRRAAALGYREEHFRDHPEQSDREYLEACFRAVASFPAVAPLYDERHNPLWRLGPTADGARVLRETLTAVDPDTGSLVHDFTDRDLGTRFLGDLYQDLSEAAKKRYALLQTPEFVEQFILDRTLTPAIHEYGLAAVRLIDPTCGSGHFLIGAFERLFALWTEREPATTASVLAQRALDQTAGVDLNPYATAIARFRLVVAALRVCGIARLAEAPALKLHLATGDSLLHGPLPGDGATMLFDANRLRKSLRHVYESEDASELEEILGRGYHAVVGNPPYISVKDSALRDAYRERYASCHGKYVLTVPFMERFFELARLGPGDAGGYVGKITGNNFMKREFGVQLVERFLPSVDLLAILDSSRAYIPGHGIPTVLLFGRARRPTSRTVRVVDGIRTEGTQPIDAAAGRVWRSITELVDSPGQTTNYARASDVPRSELSRHPMTLGLGRELRRRLEQNARTVADLVSTVGVAAISGEDDVFSRPRDAWQRSVAPARFIRPQIGGDICRDWSVAIVDGALFPYTATELVSPPDVAILRALYPWKTTLWARQTFGRRTYREDGRMWWQWHQVTLDRLRSPITITWGLVSTHNHFVLLRAGEISRHSAPIIKFSEGAEVEDHLRLLGVLNSSVACAWLRQVCHNKGGGGIGGGIAEETWEQFVELNPSNVRELPLPPKLVLGRAAELDDLARERASLLLGLGLEKTPVSGHLRELRERDAELSNRLVSVQEELDWEVLAAYGLAPDGLVTRGLAPPLSLGERAFEIALARQAAAGEVETTWFERHTARPTTEIPSHWPSEYRAVVQQRIDLIESDADLGLIEQPEHKRRWNRAPWEDRQRGALTHLVLDALEQPELWAELRPRSTAELTDQLRNTPVLVEALELLAGSSDVDLAATVRQLVLDAAVPHLAAHRLTEKAMRKRAVWVQAWELQRAEERGEVVGPIPVPPRYAQADFRSPVFWRQRGKLDVPKERFVLIPNAERGADNSPVIGWAGWDECHLARALAGRIMELREHEAAEAERLTPLLAGVLELLPWIHQWYPESEPLYGGPPGQYFESWLDGQLAELVITRDNLRAWRPPAPTRGRKAKAGAA